MGQKLRRWLQSHDEAQSLALGRRCLRERQADMADKIGASDGSESLHFDDGGEEARPSDLEPKRKVEAE